ncbi:MAG: energy transducer TonB [Candidatus Krumholzibacteriota bacterium]|nr:energy transducer TonB [Candidatus Krumholzibacteriota bacterium]
MGKIQTYDSHRRKRLLYLFPVAIATIIILLTLVEHSRLVDHIFTVGYEGPMKLLPEITIIDDRGLEAQIFSVERDDEVIRNLEVSEEPEPESEDEEDALETVAPFSEESLEEPILDDVSRDDNIRTYASHANVPYREDYVILKMVQPEYPSDALNRGLEGYVMVEVYVNESGLVEEAWVRKVYGLRSFETASLEAVRQFEFKPVREYGKPKPFWISFLVSFKLTS